MRKRPIYSIFFLRNLTFSQKFLYFARPRMASEEEIKLYNEIISKGCCKRCALRYLGHGRTLITFDDPDICLLNVSRRILKCTVFTKILQFGHISPLDGIFENFQNKKMKKNPCAVCLDLLSDRMFGELLEHQELSKVSEYLHEHFVAYITFPPCILLRDHSMKIHLKNAFPNVFDGEGGSTAFQAH